MNASQDMTIQAIVPVAETIGYSTDLRAMAQGAEETDPSYTDSQGRQIHRSRTQEYDHVSQILQWIGYRRWQENDQAQTRSSRLAVRYTFPQELEALLHYNGFQRERCYVDWDCTPLTVASPSIISVCRKRT